MKSKIALIVAVSLMILLSAATWAGQTRQQGKTQTLWEYTQVSELSDAPSIDFNRLGTQGWELVAVRTSDESTATFVRSRIHYYFKRVK